MEYLTCSCGSESTDTQVTSDAVPAVVGMAMTGNPLPDSSSAWPRNECTVRVPVQMHAAALAVSMTDPPPSATTMSQSFSLMRSTQAWHS